MADVPQTLPVDEGGEGTRAGGRRAWLIVAWRGDRQRDPPSRHALDGFEKVAIERGDAFEAVRQAEGSKRSLTLRISDGSISSRHFSIVSAGDHRVVRDSGSRNGTLVNG